MENLKELVEQSKLAERLMEDESFIKKAKELFEKEKIEITDENLIEVLKFAEKTIQKNKTVNEKGMIDIVGGGILDKLNITGKELFEFAGKSVGLTLGLTAGFIYTEWNPTKKEDYDKMSPVRKAFNKSSYVTTLASSANIGAFLGKKLGSLIAEKFGFTDKNLQGVLIHEQSGSKSDHPGL